MNYFVGNMRKSRGIMELIEVEVAGIILLIERGRVSAKVLVALEWTKNDHHRKTICLTVELLLLVILPEEYNRIH